MTLEETSEDGRLEDASDPAEPCKQPQGDVSDDNATDCSSRDDERDGDPSSASDPEEAFQVGTLSLAPLQSCTCGQANDMLQDSSFDLCIIAFCIQILS